MLDYKDLMCQMCIMLLGCIGSQIPGLVAFSELKASISFMESISPWYMLYLIPYFYSVFIEVNLLISPFFAHSLVSRMSYSS